VSPAVKGTGAAAVVALALVEIVGWGVEIQWGLKVPGNISADFVALLTFGLGYLIHTPGTA